MGYLLVYIAHSFNVFKIPVYRLSNMWDVTCIGACLIEQNTQVFTLRLMHAPQCLDVRLDEQVVCETWESSVLSAVCMSLWLAMLLLLSSHTVPSLQSLQQIKLKIRLQNSTMVIYPKQFVSLKVYKYMYLLYFDRDANGPEAIGDSSPKKKARKRWEN